MSQITKFTLMGLLLLSGVLFLAGCGSSTPNSKASSGANSEGQHAADWLPAGHMVAAQEDQIACTECHGKYYDGGISGVSCTSCHLGGPSSIHPAGLVPSANLEEARRLCYGERKHSMCECRMSWIYAERRCEQRSVVHQLPSRRYDVDTPDFLGHGDDRHRPESCGLRVE